MNVFSVLYAILAVLVSSFFMNSYPKIEKMVVSISALPNMMKLISVYVYMFVGIGSCHLIHMLYREMVRLRQH